ncbi:hypothetical protein B0H17DRAFT_1126662 [Mycena rosella]|uniref:Uncharacterized protein n=1 Tax=Mycena rosella TaxID=1033263 RepID=A0AAD7M6Z1_MYCRO|nr:hypothetical protein B0H17DRAFT_1126662 [Mycena rosella]
MSKVTDDPRDASLETKFTLPGSWYRESFDGLSTSGMFLSGLIMVTRNRPSFIAWPAVLFGIASIINIHPMRSKDGGGAGASLSSLLLCIMALFASYMPLLMITNVTKTTTSPLPSTF